MKEWFGFRTVTKPIRHRSAIWHGFRDDRDGAPSLCGRVRFGREYLHTGGRPCINCAAKWAKRYPSVAR